MDEDKANGMILLPPEDGNIRITFQYNGKYCQDTMPISVWAELTATPIKLVRFIGKINAALNTGTRHGNSLVKCCPSSPER